MAEFKLVKSTKLSPHQRLAQLPSGDSVMVEFSARELVGPEAKDWLAIEVVAYESSGSPETPKAAGISVPTFVHTIALAQLADGSLDLEEELSKQTSKAVQHFQNLKAAKKVLASIPLATDRTLN